MRALLPIVTGTVLFAVLIALSADYYKNEIEADLTSRTKSALGDSANPKVDVLAEAQTITLQGEVASEAEKKKILDEASRVWGVVEVRNELRVRALLSPGSCETVVETLADRDPIRFTAQGFEIDSASYPTLDRIAALMTECPAAGFQVDGFAEPGSRFQHLAEARATSVVNYLIAKGTPPERLTPAPTSAADSERTRIGFSLRKP
jgi:outer membrane protein OmpA-like peptidoglycan-associated protein